MTHLRKVCLIVLCLPFVCLAQSEGTDDYANGDSPRNRFGRFGFTMGIEVGWFSGAPSPSDTASTVFSEVNASAVPGFSAAVSYDIELGSGLSLRPTTGVTILPTSISYTRFGKVSADEVQFMQLTLDAGAYLTYGETEMATGLGSILGLLYEVNLQPTITNRITPEVGVVRLEAGVSFPLKIGNTATRLALVYSITATPAFGETTVYEQWWSSHNRQRVAMRLAIF